MTETNDRATRNPPIFLDLPEVDTLAKERKNPKPVVRKKRRPTKHDRYEVTRMEKAISRRVRRDGSGKTSYEVQVWINGRAVNKTMRTLRDARRWRDEMLGKRATGSLRVPTDRRMTVSRFVSSEWHEWLDAQVSFGNLRESTVSWYKTGAKRLVSEIGRAKVANVGKSELRGMLARRVEAGDSASVLKQLRATTRSVLALAVESDILMEDPSGFMTGRSAPRVLRRADDNPKAWSESEAHTFLRYVKDDKLEALWILLLGSGLRRGEALGLRWDDVDFEGHTVSVSRSLGLLDGALATSNPKTGHSVRTISVGQSVISALHTHRKRQAHDRLAAETWLDVEAHIFLTDTGGRLRPDYTTRRFKQLVGEAGLPWIRLHGCRHTMAAIALQNGVDIATVSERLGHADVNITARIYLHGSKESDRAAADTLDAALHG